MPAYSTPSLHIKPTNAQVKDIRKQRDMGLYSTKETMNELYYCLDNLPDDSYALTLQHLSGCFMEYPRERFAQQVKIWKQLGATCLEANVKSFDYRGKTFWRFVINPADLKDAPYGCPLAMAFNTVVSGYTYITPSKAVADWVVRQLKKE